MKKLICSLILIFGFSVIFAQNARIQIIHNAADPAAQEVDVYVNGDRALNDFAFRSATPFIDLPAGVLLNIGVAPGTSNAASDTLKNFQVILEENKTYVAVANGVLDPSLFSPNPEGIDISFTLFAKDNIRESGRRPWAVDFVVLHGASDAPSVDIIAKRAYQPISNDLTDNKDKYEETDGQESFWWGGKIVNNASYGDITRYKRIFARQYILKVTPANDNNTIVAKFDANLNGLGGGAAVVFASGFLNSAANQNGASFGIFAALPDGNVVEFPQILPKARLQVIHNAADPMANEVDVYINDELTLDDFAFRSATPFIDIPAGVPLNIGVAPGNSSSAGDILKNFAVQFNEGETYIAVANGVLDTTDFTLNPDGRDIFFTLFSADGIRESGNSNNKVDFVVLHGSTDAPTVDVIARNAATIVNDAAYGDITDYIRVWADNYMLDITPGNDNNTIVASFRADLSGLGGGSAVVFASGFLNPAGNQNVAPFGLFAALPDGNVVEFPAVDQIARLQVIHNAADPIANEVDVYLNGDLALNDFAFRTATPYIDVPSDVPVNIGVAPGNSTSADDTLKNFTVQFASGGTYVAIANGVVDPSGFSINPSGRDIAFTLFAKGNAREQGSSNNRTDLFVVHGSTDAPEVNILGVGLYLRNVSYGDISNYYSLPAWRNWIVITTPRPNFGVVGVWNADLRGLGGKSAVVFASGFLDPSSNQNGEEFGLFAALADGSVVELSKLFGRDAQNSLEKVLGENGEVTSVVADYGLDQNYPNPFNPSTLIKFSIPQNEFVSLKIYDVIGNEVANLANEQRSAGSYEITFNAGNLSSGVYIYTLKAGNFVQTKKLMLLK